MSREAPGEGWPSRSGREGLQLSRLPLQEVRVLFEGGHGVERARQRLREAGGAVDVLRNLAPGSWSGGRVRRSESPGNAFELFGRDARCRRRQGLGIAFEASRSGLLVEVGGLREELFRGLLEPAAVPQPSNR